MSAQGCAGCRGGEGFETPFTMAFQPIVDMRTHSVFAYEALVRGPQGQGAASILETVNTTNRYAFDQGCRVKAIDLASTLGLADQGALLSINFLPNAVYDPAACIRLTLATARRNGFPLDRLLFEFTESERVEHDHLGRIIAAYRALGFRTAIDDFGAGYSGLTLLAKFQPDIVKLDMELVRDIDTDRVKRLLVGGVVSVCREIGVEVLAEGIETLGEHLALLDLGIWLQQGYLMAKPGFECLPPVVWPASPPVAAAA
ncbi:EAL domain-containing protein [Caulobacter sp. S45]|uniref:EAL domain-containing protein n=1 Tax=Caulobacter sp. S45 TaxID=1641861 RepID=UPI001577445D|nr:EAL domain-containing protein [Caulobacter sp. S45]